MTLWRLLSCRELELCHPIDMHSVFPETWQRAALLPGGRTFPGI